MGNVQSAEVGSVRTRSELIQLATKEHFALLKACHEGDVDGVRDVLKDEGGRKFLDKELWKGQRASSPPMWATRSISGPCWTRRRPGSAWQ